MKLRGRAIKTLDLSNFAHKLGSQDTNKDIQFVRTPITQPKDFDFRYSPNKKVNIYNKLALYEGRQFPRKRFI